MAAKEGTHEHSDGWLGSVSFRTNGPQGGDAGHGGFLEVTFDTAGSMALDVDVDGHGARNVEKTAVLRFMGDAEMSAAREYFRYLAENL